MMLSLKIAILASFYVSFAGASNGDLFDAAYLCHADNEKEYCPTDATCKPDGDCSECDGNYDVDNKYHLCVSNNPRICQRQNKKYCPSDNSCVTGCSSCAYFTSVDNNKHICMQPNPITCGNLRGGSYGSTKYIYCPHFKSCIQDTQCTSSCGHYKYADRTNHRCVHVTSPRVCRFDAEKLFCPSDRLCKPHNDCTSCTGFNFADNVNHICIKPDETSCNLLMHAYRLALVATSSLNLITKKSVKIVVLARRYACQRTSAC